MKALLVGAMALVGGSQALFGGPARAMAPTTNTGGERAVAAVSETWRWPRHCFFYRQKYWKRLRTEDTVSNDPIKTSPAAHALAGNKLGMLTSAGALAITALLGTSGCTASLAAEPSVVAYDNGYAEGDIVTVPEDVRTYPHMYYGGNYTYLVDGRWVYPSNRGWRAYRNEPGELRTYRAQVYASPREHVAPPERRFEGPAVNAYPRPTVRQRR